MQLKLNLLKLNLKTASLVATVFLLPLSGMSRNSAVDSAKIQLDESRIELKLQQRHSGVVSEENMYADGIKIMRDLSIMKNLEQRMILNAGEIPADDLYKGMWANKGVRSAYRVLDNKNIPDSFRVNLANFTMPTKGSRYGQLTSKFGPRRRRMHYGFDLKVLTGDTIYATFDGKVRVKQYERRGYGYYLVLRHTNGLETVYGHLSKFLVEEDQVVKSGEPIALGGNTGRSSGAHLHFEFRFLGRAIDPELIVDVNNQACRSKEFLVTKKVLTPHRNASTEGVYYASASKSVASPNRGGDVKYYNVRPGDSLGSIARKHRTSVSVICRLNNLSSETVLQVGKTLKLR